MILLYKIKVFLYIVKCIPKFLKLKVKNDSCYSLIYLGKIYLSSQNFINKYNNIKLKSLILHISRQIKCSFVLHNHCKYFNGKCKRK